MNILVISWSDSYNFALPPVIRTLLNHGHSVEIALNRTEHEHKRMFNSLDVPKHDGVKELSFGRFDVALYQCLPDDEIADQLRQHDVFQVGMYYHLTPDEHVIAPQFTTADITFCFGERFVRNQRSHGIHQELVPIGSPQYDTLPDPSSMPTDIGVLILEQHLYPAGDTGKRQLASMILNIARANPDRRVTVKPRTIPSQTDVSTHQSKHVFEFVKEQVEANMPENIYLLREHRDLNDLIARAATVVTTFSTAAVPAMLLEKPLVFVRGFDHQPTYHYNEKVVAAYYKFLSETGCVVSHDEAVDAIGDATPVADDFLDDFYEDSTQNVASKIVEILESVQETVDLATPLPVLNLRYDSHRDKLAAFDSGQRNWQDKRVRDRQWFEQRVTQSLFKLYNIDKMSGFQIGEFRDDFLAKINELRAAIEDSQSATLDRDSINTELNKLTDSTIEDAVDYLISEKVADLPIGFKGWYTKRLYENGQIEDLETLSPALQVLDCDYYLGLTAFKNGEYDRAITHLKRYMSSVDEISYELTPASTGSMPRTAYKHLLLSQLKQLQIAGLVKTLTKYEEYPESWAPLVQEGYHYVFR